MHAIDVIIRVTISGGSQNALWETGLLFLFPQLLEPGRRAETAGCLVVSTSYNLSSLVMPSVYLRWSRVRLVSEPCLFSKSLRIFLFRWINRCESYCRCFSCSLRSLWMRFKSAASANCCVWRSFASFF